MKCIEADCTAFYVDPLSKECILGSLQDPCIASQLPNAGITVYRNKDLKKLDCLDCLMENGFDYSGYDLNYRTRDATGATDALSCWSFCRSNYPNAKYFTFVHRNDACMCKTNFATRRQNAGADSGEVICNGKLLFGNHN